MAADINDKFTETTNGTRPVPTTLTAILSSGASPGTATVGALTGWPTATAVHFIIYTTDVNGAKVAGSQTDWKGIVSGSTLTNLTLKAGTNSGYSVGAVVEAAPTAAWADDLTEGIRVEHNQDGTHADITADSITINSSGSVDFSNAPLATADLADAAVTSAKLAEAFFRGRYQADTTNSAPTGLTVQYGWGQKVGDGSTQMSESVTFPTAFSSAPTVIISSIGQTPTSTPATGITGFSDTPDAVPVTIQTKSISTTGLTVYFTKPSGSLSVSHNYGYSWIAIGTV